MGGGVNGTFCTIYVWCIVVGHAVSYTEAPLKRGEHIATLQWSRV